MKKQLDDIQQLELELAQLALELVCPYTFPSLPPLYIHALMYLLIPGAPGYHYIYIYIYIICATLIRKIVIFFPALHVPMLLFIYVVFAPGD